MDCKSRGRVMTTLRDKTKAIQRHIGVADDGIYGDDTANRLMTAFGIELPKRTMRDAAAFFAGVRKVVAPLSPEQVDIINRLLIAAGHWPTAWLAYGLATAWHEARLRPIKEVGGDAYYFRMYDIGGARPAVARRLGNLAPGDGVKFAGRGLPQLTGRTNYEKASAALGVDFVAAPDKVLDPQHAVDVMVWGMETGAFTGISLADRLPNEIGTFAQFVGARPIINSTDRAADIAKYAVAFQDDIKAGGWS